MPKKTFFCEDNYAKIVQSINKICSDMHRNRFEYRILINEVILKECFVSAEGSIKFYNLDEKEVSHYKEIAHIAYWVNRLKPIRVGSPYTIKSLLTKVRDSVTDVATGFKVKIEEAMEYPIDDKKLLNGLEYPINEYVAYFLATDHIRACQYAEAKQQGFTAEDAYKIKIAESQKKVDYMKETIILSMRYHNYSARGFALMLEALTRIDSL